ncbi:hypothetical protein GLIP_3610 [Aliiglaciecola lipolytica E3]|uniref:Sulfatase N-terminal domain-containing protein n=2 Tax=Aliiglaciecola TaxID=1406885 RepID=K6XX45_9ALTE|nr:hypothetical protein GLIP_3610 [Aliiglaciecola lipolytica E3]
MFAILCILSGCEQAPKDEIVTTEKATEEKPPNIIFILADDLGYGDVGVYGATKIKTPNIDKLASQGRMFTDAHSVSAVCTPSRYALLTGKYPMRAKKGARNQEVGVWGPLPIESELIIETDELTLGKMLQNKGYKTAAIGKWHLGFKQGQNDWQMPLSPGPLDVGFDYYYGVPIVNSAPPYVLVENETVVEHDPKDPLVYLGPPRSRTNTEVQPTPIKEFPKEASQKTQNHFGGALAAHMRYDDEQLGIEFTHKAIDWIDANKQDPFFLYFSTTQVHHPFTPSPKFKGTSEIGLYGDFVHELDWMVGELMTYLEENDLADNTLVVFTSDNGGMLNLGGRNAYEAGHKINGDLLGFKFGVWEGGHRVPFIARWPGKIGPRETSDQLISLVDMYSTFASLTGQENAVPKDTNSINVLPALLGTTTNQLREELVIAPRQPKNLALRDGKWVYIPAKGSGGFRGSKPSAHAWGGAAAVNFVGGVNSDMADGKLLPDAPPAQLYDIASDPYQSTNLYHTHPEIVERMEAKLKAIIAKEQG